MAKTSREFEEEFVEGLKRNTGKNLDEWMKAITAKGFAKRNDLIAWLKTEHNFGHGVAALMAGIHTNGGKPVYGDTDALLDNLFEKKEALKPLYEILKGAIAAEVKDAKFIAMKTYVSVADKREFAVICIKAGELRLGLDLADEPFTDYLQPAKTLGAMPRYTHMVVIKSEEDLKGPWKEYLHKSYNRVHKK